MPAERTDEYKRDIHWPTVLYYIHLHALGLYGALLLFTEAKWLTVFFSKYLSNFLTIIIIYVKIHKRALIPVFHRISSPSRKKNDHFIRTLCKRLYATGVLLKRNDEIEISSP